MPDYKTMLLRKRERLREEPARARVEARATSRLVSGFESHARTRTFELTLDQPETSGGTDRGPRPSEYVLAALAACHEVTYRLYADALHIPLHGVAVTVTGESDARGFLCPDAGLRPGFQRIRGTVYLDTPAGEADIARLRDLVNRCCPVLDDLRTPIDVALEVVRGPPPDRT